jgi:hypothetical protein
MQRFFDDVAVINPSQHGGIHVTAGSRTQDPFHLESIGPDSSSPAKIHSGSVANLLIYNPDSAYALICCGYL